MCAHPAQSSSRWPCRCRCSVVEMQNTRCFAAHVKTKFPNFSPHRTPAKLHLHLHMLPPITTCDAAWLLKGTKGPPPAFPSSVLLSLCVLLDFVVASISETSSLHANRPERHKRILRLRACSPASRPLHRTSTKHNSPNTPDARPDTTRPVGRQRAHPPSSTTTPVRALNHIHAQLSTRHTLRTDLPRSPAAGQRVPR